MTQSVIQSKRGKSHTNQRIGRVTIYLRGKTWYLYYYENGQRKRYRVRESLKNAKVLAAQVNAQLVTHTPTILSYHSVSISDLRQRWINYHEQVLRSSLTTICRYRSATDHLINFSNSIPSVRSVDTFSISHTEAFTQYLRNVKVSPNGHPNTAKRPLRDKGVRFILETCRALFNYAIKHRHLPPYQDNPFSQLEIGRIPIEDAKPIELLTNKQEEAFWAACDGWQFPIFLTMAFTGLRPGELVHLLLPEDVDLKHRLIKIRNKPDLGWQTKTRNERDIPIVSLLGKVLKQIQQKRRYGPFFLRRRFFQNTSKPILSD